MQSAETRAREQWALWETFDPAAETGRIDRSKPPRDQLVLDTSVDANTSYGTLQYTNLDGKRRFVYHVRRKQWVDNTPVAPSEPQRDLTVHQRWERLAEQLPGVRGDDLTQDTEQFRDASTRYTSRSTGAKYVYCWATSQWRIV